MSLGDSRLGAIATLETSAMKPPAFTHLLAHPDGLVFAVSLVSLALTIGSILLG